MTSADPSDYVLPEELFQRIQTPALVVYLDKVRANLERMRSLTQDGERWRPHLKTTKIPAVWAELLAAGMRRFKCATVREARHLLAQARSAGALDVDLLVAYPLIGPALGELGRLADAHPGAKLAVLAEDPEAVAASDSRIGVFVDVNPGMHRTGVPVTDFETILAVVEAAGERFRGVHYYDGHLHAGSQSEQQRAVFDCYGPLLELLERLRARCAAPGQFKGEVITSGTPTFVHPMAFEPFEKLDGFVHRVSPGTVVFHDRRSEEECGDLGLAPAALVCSRVISHPAPDLATCDAGSKSIAAEAGDPCAFILGRAELQALTPSEEHLPLRVTGGERPARGDQLLLFPRHVCPTVNLAEEALLIEADGSHRVEAVAARAHDLLASDLA